MSLTLFVEETPVSESEVEAWLNTVPNLSTSKFRREAYRKAYNIEEKIRAYKKNGKTKELAKKLKLTAPYHAQDVQ